MKQTVSLCMIVRNEAANLPDCLRSVAGLVDEVVIVDTGSTDQTKEIAREFGARVIESSWTDDFSAARNESLKHVTRDWILWLDADDRLDEPNRTRLAQVLNHLQPAVAGPHPVFVMACCSPRGGGCARIDQIRLFPVAARLTWRGRIHEALETTDSSGLVVQVTDVAITHLGYGNPAIMARKRQRDLRLLQLNYVLNPDDMPTLFYLGRTFLEASRLEEALTFLKRLLSRVGRPDTTPAAEKLLQSGFLFTADCLLKLGRRQESLQVCEAGLSRYGDDIELLYHRGRMLFDDNRFHDAEACFQRLVNLPSQMSITGVDTELIEKSHYMLGVICQKHGRIAEAESHLRLAVARRPDYPEAWLQLGQLYLVASSSQGVAFALAGMAACSNARFENAVLNAVVCASTGRYAEAKRFIAAALAGRPNDLELRLLLADAIFNEHLNWRECVTVHQQILAQEPRLVPIRERLAMVLATKKQWPAGRGCEGVLELAGDRRFAIAG